VWEDATPVYVLRRADGRGGVLLVERVEHAEIRVGDKIVAPFARGYLMLTNVHAVGRASVAVGPGAPVERWGTTRDREKFDGMLRVLGTPTADGRIKALPADHVGLLEGYRLYRDALV
jgi:hypothetical protein